jgi:murein L,D-transpeptidase YafK
MKKKKIFCLFSLVALCFLICLLAPPWDGSSIALPAKTPTDKVPVSLLKWPEKGTEYAILVDKSLQKVFVYRRDNPHEPHRTYACSTGENQGPKLRQNDRKTPEGVYFFVRSYDKKELLPIYGSRAYALDYPNAIDRREGKNGHGIWFHGLNKPLKPRDTNGCVALENSDIDELANFIRVEETPVIVSERIEMVAYSEMEKEREQVVRILETWRTSWERKDVDKYMSLYSPDFTASGKNWQQWKEHKARLAQQYKRIKVDVQNLQILKNDELVVASFVQKYSNEHFNSTGRKTIYLKHGSQLKIISENFEGSEIKPSIMKDVPSPEDSQPMMAKKPPEIKPGESSLAVVRKEPLPGGEESKPGAMKKEPRPALEDHRDLRKALEEWKKAWEQKDLASYMSFYDSDFQSRGMDFSAWKKHREKLNQKYRSISVGISDLKIEQTSAVMARVSFTQKYGADDYEDKGLKSLLLVKRGKGWKIKEEEWKPLDQESRP